MELLDRISCNWPGVVRLEVGSDAGNDHIRNVRNRFIITHIQWQTFIMVLHFKSVSSLTLSKSRLKTCNAWAESTLANHWQSQLMAIALIVLPESFPRRWSELCSSLKSSCVDAEIVVVGGEMTARRSGWWVLGWVQCWWKVRRTWNPFLGSASTPITMIWVVSAVAKIKRVESGENWITLAPCCDGLGVSGSKGAKVLTRRGCRSPSPTHWRENNLTS